MKVFLVFAALWMAFTAAFNFGVGRVAHADYVPCVDGPIGPPEGDAIIRVCDKMTGVICYKTTRNGHGIEMLSCVRP